MSIQRKAGGIGDSKAGVGNRTGRAVRRTPEEEQRGGQQAEHVFEAQLAKGLEHIERK